MRIKQSGKSPAYREHGDLQKEPEYYLVALYASDTTPLKRNS